MNERGEEKFEEHRDTLEKEEMKELIESVDAVECAVETISAQMGGSMPLTFESSIEANNTDKAIDQVARAYLICLCSGGLVPQALQRVHLASLNKNKKP